MAQLETSAVLFLTVLSFALCSACKAASETHHISRAEKIIVVDSNGVPVAGATLYRQLPLIFDPSEKRFCLGPQAQPITQTDPNGVLYVRVPNRGRMPLFLLSDEFMTRVVWLRPSGKNQPTPQTITLAPAAQLSLLFQSPEVFLKNVFVDLMYWEPDTRSQVSLITADWQSGNEANSLPLHLICPSGCNLKLYIRPNDPLQPIEKTVRLLKSGETFEVGTIAFQPFSGHRLIGKTAPKLHVRRWVKGKPTTLEELRGKVVVLEFWGLWCLPCGEKLTELAKLHKKYSRDGLVIMGIHDSSGDEQALTRSTDKNFVLSKVPFNIAIDAPPADRPRGAVSKGKTIDAYQVSKFPTIVVIDKNGSVEGFGMQNLEKRINLLLYGKISSRYGKAPTLFDHVCFVARQYLVQILILGAIVLFSGMYILVKLGSRQENKTVS